MDRFAELDDRYDPHATEERVFDHWDAVDAYERTKAHRAEDEDYYFLDGPPYTTGAPHLGTAWNKTLKDLYIRYHRMQGYDVYDRPGYDMHGLPIETGVEEELGFETKKDIKAYGVENFIEQCQEFAAENLEAMNEVFQSLGIWMDWEEPYKTVDPTYMEAAWWGFQRVHNRGLVERGKRSISQCPRCETAIAKNEVEFHEVEDPSIYVKFRLVGREGSLVIWTTTPWTIPGNTFVAVSEELTYQAVSAEKGGESEVLYIEESLVEEVLKKGRYQDYEVLDEVSGDEMVGWEYEHPLGDIIDHPGGEGAFCVYTADYVEADRSGLVHSAPGHGEEDFERGSELELELFCPVGEDGVYDERAGPYAGQFVRDANPEIIDDLRDRGHLLADETYVHDYGQCWRCDTDIIQIVTDQWFINTSEFKNQMLELLDDSDWYPVWAKEHRFRDFIEASPDWNVSRQRYWGIPLPIWTPEDWDGDVEAVIVVGTREELADRVDQGIDPAAVDLHKPTVDDLTITEDGKTYTRVPDVFDVWLDSGVASWAALGYPETEDRFEKLWPADLIMEAHDQTRGWFWSLLAMGTVVFDENPYEQVLMHGHTLAEDGRKMSKSVGNVVEPAEAIERHGRDAVRLFLLSATPQGDDMRFSWDEMGEMGRRLNILWNAVRFPLPYMAMDGFEPADADLTTVADDLEVLDRWLLSRLEAVEEEATAAMDEFANHEAVEAVLDFVVEDVSRYYIQTVRERMWEEADTASKRAAYATLATVLRETIVMLAPFAPFVTEALYQRLTGEREHPTVHMADWPGADDYRDADLEAAIDVVRSVEEAGSHARQRAGRKLRWPVARVVVDAEDESVVDALEAHGELLAERLNARTVEVVAPGEDWSELRYTADADMSVLGPAFGEDAGEVMEALNQATVDAPDLDALETAVAESLGRDIEVTDEMVDFVEVIPDDVAGAEFEGGTVYVDTTLTDELEAEGYAREVVRRVQEMRKELDLDVEQQLRLDIQVFDERVAELVARHEEFVAEEVRAAELGAVDDGHEREWEVEGVRMRFVVEPLAETVA